MASENPLKRLWTEYNKFKNWALSTNPREFTIESSSLDDDETTTSSAIDNNGTASATQDKFVSITGLIYPSTEPFRQWALRVEIKLPILYPHKATTVYMKTSIRHPNIDENGE
jgi:ubiquitin-protein ligase